ncbi:MAG: DUF1453 family protein [Alphaproteobacteria bacterium]|nr:DUF1453 family protein [Alphaproteobacteria bacterium]
MQGSAGAPKPLVTYVIMAVVLVIVLGLRMRSVGRERPLKVGRLWIIPAIYLAVAVAFFVMTPPARPLEWGLSLIALALGAAVGWQRGRLIHIAVDPATEAVRMKQSMLGFLFIVVLVALKMGMRSMPGFGNNGLLHMSPQGLTDILVALMLGLLGMQRVEMFLRARRLLAEARQS